MSFGQYIYLVKSDADGDSQIAKDWTTSFRTFLELLLSKLSGEKILVNEVNCDEWDAEKMYSPLSLLIPVVSPELLNSTNFKDELKIFHEKAINKGVNNISWNSRVFKVMKEPMQGHFLLDYLSDSVNYEFYHRDGNTDELVYYDDFTGPTSEKTFWMRLYDLAYDIFQVMGNLKSQETEIAEITKDINAVTIFLSEVGADLFAERDAVKRELQRNGFKVLPEKNMPSEYESIVKLVKKDLKSSNLSIHLVGSDYGTINTTSRSIIELQNQLALDHFNELEQMNDESMLNMGRVVWIAPELKNLSVKQRVFIDNLKKDSFSTSRADLLQSSIEELKAFVISKVDYELSQHQKVFGEIRDKKKIIYLIHERSDLHACKKIESTLLKDGFEVISSKFSGDPDKIRFQHNENLKKCDATLIYYGSDNIGWIKSKQNELLKSLGMGRDKPIGPQAILIENELQLDESVGLDKDAIIIQNQKRFSKKVIDPFLEKLKV